MLSGHLPGQETGNVKHVLRHGFGAYSREPHVIAETVCSWLEDPERLAAMSSAALASSRPDATVKIADDIAALVTEASGGATASAPPLPRRRKRKVRRGLVDARVA